MLDKISTSFLQLLSEQTYDQITIRDIMNEAALPRTSFYNFYDSKDDLAETILMNQMSEIFNYMTQKFTDRTKDNQITAKSLEDLLIKQEIISKLWQINNRHVNLTDKLEKHFSRSVQQAVYHRFPNAKETDLTYFGDLFAACTVKTIAWYFANANEVTTEALANKINICLYDGMIHLFD